MLIDADNRFMWDDPNKPKLKDRPFNAWRVPRSDSTQRVINDVLNQLQNYEKHLRLRKRKRKASDQETFEKTSFCNRLRAGLPQPCPRP